jgi:DNA-binding NtrC family response regulator
MATILVIDPNPCIRDLLHHEFSAEGYAVAGTDEIESLQDWIISTEPELVILDIYFKRQTRWGLLSEIKDHNPRVPVIVYTAYGGYAKDPRLSIADGFVIKSLFFDELKRQVAEILTGKPTPQPNTEKKTRLQKSLQLLPVR